MDQKMQSIAAYKSQFFDTNSDEPETPITSKNAWNSLKYRNENLGRLIGTEAAEGYTVERYPAVESFFDLI
jgi:hypothetical protein